MTIEALRKTEVWLIFRGEFVLQFQPDFIQQPAEVIKAADFFPGASEWRVFHAFKI